MRSHLADRDVVLPDDVDLEIDESGEVCSFSARMGDAERDFQLRAEGVTPYGDTLSVFKHGPLSAEADATTASLIGRELREVKETSELSPRAVSCRGRPPAARCHHAGHLGVAVARGESCVLATGMV